MTGGYIVRFLLTSCESILSIIDGVREAILGTHAGLSAGRTRV